MWLILVGAPALAFRPTPDTLVLGDPGARLGDQVLEAGDFDGDGYDDLAAVGFDAVYVYPGASVGLRTNWVWSRGNWGDAEALDANGDGFDDLVVLGTGRAELYLGSAAGLAASPAWTTPVLAAPARYASGDLNRDGYDDLVLSDPRNLGYAGPSNLVMVFGGGPGGLSPAAGRTWSGGWKFGFEVAVSDLDGDGYPDVVVGAPYTGVAGQVVGYRGTSGLPAPTPTWTVSGAGLALSDFGERLAGGVDLNGDGFEDLGVAYAGAGFERSFARVYGGPAGPGSPNGTTARRGQWLALDGCPDADGDGDDELLVGWQDAVVGGISTGAAGLFDDGRVAPVFPVNVFAGDADGDDAGSAVGAGDFDGDGAIDWAVGARHANGNRGAIGVRYDAP